MGLGAVAFEAAGNLNSYANGRSIKGPGWRPWPDVGLAQEQQAGGRLVPGAPPGGPAAAAALGRRAPGRGARSLALTLWGVRSGLRQSHSWSS